MDTGSNPVEGAMENKEEYLNGILSEIEKRKANNKIGVFRIGAHISDNTAKYIKQQLENIYHVEITKCVSCKQSWNIVILF